MIHTYNDIFGQQLNIGDYIVYSTMAGQSATMRVGKIVGLSEAKDESVRYGKGAYTGIKAPKLKVKSASLHYDDTPIVSNKIVTLEHFSRV